MYVGVRFNKGLYLLEWIAFLLFLDSDIRIVLNLNFVFMMHMNPCTLFTLRVFSCSFSRKYILDAALALAA